MPGFNITGEDVGGEPHTTEASRRHRYLVNIMGPLSRTLTFFAHKVTIPVIEFDRIVMHHKQDEIYLPGKQRWSPCEVSFYRIHDGSGDLAAIELYNWWAKTILNINTAGLVGNSRGAIDKRTCEIHMLTGNGQPIYKYIMYGVWPQKATPSSLDASDSAIADIQITLQIDKMIEEPIAQNPFISSMCEPNQSQNPR